MPAPRVETRAPSPANPCASSSIMARLAEYMPYSHGTTMFFQYALAYPCLVPQNLRELEGDGGLLSVWDACNYLLRHAQEHKEVLSFHALCAPC